MEVRLKRGGGDAALTGMGTGPGGAAAGVGIMFAGADVLNQCTCILVSARSICGVRSYPC